MEEAEIRLYQVEEAIKRLEKELEQLEVRLARRIAALEIKEG